MIIRSVEIEKFRAFENASFTLTSLDKGTQPFVVCDG